MAETKICWDVPMSVPLEIELLVLQVHVAATYHCNMFPRALAPLTTVD